MKKEQIGKILLFAIPVVLVAGFMYSMKNTDEKKVEIEDISVKTEIKDENNSKVEDIKNIEEVKEKIEEKKEEIESGEIIKKEEKKDKENKMEIGKEYTTESGLKYEVIKLGEGEKPALTDTVEVHYHGTLENGSVFDSSVQRNEKISFPLNQVIQGWQEGLQLMPVGSKFKFTIPADLAYGQQALPGIPAGSTLIFEVELFDIK